MNLEILYTLRERLKNILITGTSLLSEDFRLKKAVEEMALLAKVAPVFAQIDAMARALLKRCWRKGNGLIGSCQCGD